MTVTDAPPEAATAAPHDAPATGGGLAAAFGTADHVTIGRYFVLASVLFLLIGSVAGSLLSVERIDPTSLDVLSGREVSLFASMHVTTTVFLFLLPAFLGVAIAIVPLQIGASTVAFPRATAAAFWTWLLSGGAFIASYLLENGGPAGSNPEAVTLWVVSLGGVLIGLTLATICVVTTLWTLRTAGMGLDRVPFFSWSMLVAGTVWLVSLPVLLAALLLGYLDAQYASGTGGTRLLFWGFGMPQALSWSLPALGLALDAAQTAAGGRARFRGVLLGALAAVGVLGFGADTLYGFVDPAANAGILQDALYVVGAFAVLLPLLVLLGGVGDILRSGRLRLTSPLLLGAIALVGLLLGAAVNAVRVVDTLDLVGTTADAAAGHLVLGAGAIGVVAALHHWASKLFGSRFAEGLGITAGVFLLGGALLLSLPDLVSGFLDQVGGLAGAGEVEDGVEALNVVSLLGGLLLVLGVVLVLVNLAVSASGRGRADDDVVPADPWGTGVTLEWQTSSPPTAADLGPRTPVRSAEPLLDDAAEVPA